MSKKYFVGWFVVVILTTGIFRTFEYFSKTNEPRKRKEIFLIPLIGYLFLYFSFFSLANKTGLQLLLVPGSIAMVPFIILGATLYLISIRHQ